MIYILVFIASVMLIAVSRHFAPSSRIRKILVICSLLLPCAVAGMRSLDIGTDVNVYAARWFKNSVRANSFAGALGSIHTTDILYVFMNYVVGLFTNDIGVLFFVAQAITILPIYYVLSKNENKHSVVLGMLLYYLFFYNISLNLMRQSISLSFSLLAFYYLKKGNMKNYILSLIISTLFHFSGILGIVYLITDRLKTTTGRKIFLAIAACIVVNVILFLPHVLQALYTVGILPERYLAYSTVYIMSTLDINVTREMYFGLITLITFLYCGRKMGDIKVLSLLGFLLFQLGLASNFAYRVSYLFFYPALFIGIPGSFKMNKKQVYLIAILVFCMVAYWIHQIIILKVHGTYPYEIRAGII